MIVRNMIWLACLKWAALTKLYGYIVSCAISVRRNVELHLWNTTYLSLLCYASDLLLSWQKPRVNTLKKIGSSPAKGERYLLRLYSAGNELKQIGEQKISHNISGLGNKYLCTDDVNEGNPKIQRSSKECKVLGASWVFSVFLLNRVHCEPTLISKKRKESRTHSSDKKYT